MVGNRLFVEAVLWASRTGAPWRDLPEVEQEHMASLILDELADEHRWEEKFARDADMLSALGAQALAEDERGRNFRS